MTLADYLTRHGISDADFAARLRLNTTSIIRYRVGTRIPRRALMVRIYNETGGAVTPNDWYPDITRQKKVPTAENAAA